MNLLDWVVGKNFGRKEWWLKPLTQVAGNIPLWLQKSAWILRPKTLKYLQEEDSANNVPWAFDVEGAMTYTSLGLICWRRCFVRLICQYRPATMAYLKILSQEITHHIESLMNVLWYLKGRQHWEDQITTNLGQKHKTTDSSIQYTSSLHNTCFAKL